MNNISAQDLDEFNRQKKQAEMIKQYLQVTNIDTTNSLLTNHPTVTEYETSQLPNTTTMLPLSSVNFNELRKDLKMGEERVKRLREELKEIQKKRDDSFIKTLPPPPPPYIPPSINNRSTSPLVQEFLSSRQMINNPILLPNYNSMNHLSTVPADVSKDHRQRQFFLTMSQHREQLIVYLDSLKQALNSLDRLASLEPTRNEVHLANMKLDTIQQKSRQLRALKSNRSSQQSPFIECRIRQLEHDLVFMLSEYQKDVHGKLELNEQRSIMLLKIMQVADELSSVDQQIQQLSYNQTDMHQINLSPSSNDMNQQQPLRIINATNNLDERHVSFRDLTDSNPLTKLTNLYYQHHHHHH
ncbi:unnamed protein product [Adineta steineri]|uniref:Uncharacterized protein n=1 Tax=Adineta steineri TaxID=433720 RepID=A0A814TEZ0_9BILA|nr:unnamed protein product [Adineta steineri]CAF1157320.1 unnamed protein product [Adineta steineri]CAF1592929.1 unnamed protein product [Adineta steineri]CAF1594447.1 unnamed protein product [Adineta steineri]